MNARQDRHGQPLAVRGVRPGAGRCLLVGTGATLGFLAVARPLVADLTTAAASGPVAFTELLVRGSAVLALICATWLWLCTALVVVDALRHHGHRPRPGVPQGWRRIVLAACGVALTGAVLGPAAQAAPAEPGPPTVEGHLLDGLPLPERATGGGPARSPSPALRVRPGDTLWGLAAQQLPASADPATIASLWHRIYAHNAAVIGPDPDLLLPGQRLHLPSPAHGATECCTHREES
ncbi:LysM peptidoglycan-binding domain-containing protein [Nocardioides sp.]|uniref:LysM peptidoglycan-binding domain-containing protein n=1 Tax=Nocardioides sp. TaxID=35761 RepID=UPI0035696CA0